MYVVCIIVIYFGDGSVQRIYFDPDKKKVIPDKKVEELEVTIVLDYNGVIRIVQADDETYPTWTNKSVNGASARLPMMEERWDACMEVARKMLIMDKSIKCKVL